MIHNINSRRYGGVEYRQKVGPQLTFPLFLGMLASAREADCLGAVRWPWCCVEIS